MAYDQATFTGIKEQVLIIWKQMNETFAGRDFLYTWNTPWYWEQTYENSLKAQEDYFRQLVNRLDLYQQTYEKMLQNATNPVLVEDWYHRSIQNFRDEMKREGGLDWVIHDAWYLNIQPLAYWSLFYVVPIEIILLVAILHKLDIL
jgi:hypothetical protein